MLFQSFILSSAAFIAVQGALIAPTGIPNGVYLQYTYTNGTRVTQSLDSDRADIVSLDAADAVDLKARSPPSAKLRKRDGGCFGYALDNSGVDGAANGLRDWCGVGHELTSGGNNEAVFVTQEDVIVYYCIDAPNSAGNCDRDDVNYALAQMDAMCRRYEASWFKWPGSFEIIGKDRTGARVCV